MSVPVRYRPLDVRYRPVIAFALFAAGGAVLVLQLRQLAHGEFDLANAVNTLGAMVLLGTGAAGPTAP